jgi:hypothetical protein
MSRPGTVSLRLAAASSMCCLWEEKDQARFRCSITGSDISTASSTAFATHVRPSSTSVGQGCSHTGFPLAVFFGRHADAVHFNDVVVFTRENVCGAKADESRLKSPL